jgi:hypothetical protein
MTWHKKISFVKSLIRIVGGVLAIMIWRDDPAVAVCTFMVMWTMAEALGIVEELSEP